MSTDTPPTDPTEPDPTTTAEAVDAPHGPSADQGGATPQNEDDDGDGDPQGGRRDPTAQAARYRRRLRDVETERDTLTTERDTARSALLRDVLIRTSNLAPSALDEPDVIPAWDTVLDEAGHVSPELIRAHMAELGRTRPHLFHRSVDPIQGRTRGGNAGDRTTWSDVLSGKATRA